MSPLAVGGIQAAPGPTWGFWVVECPTWVQWVLLWGFLIPCWCLQLKVFTCHKEEEDPIPSPCTSGLCWRVGGSSSYSLWVGQRTSKVHGPSWWLSGVMKLWKPPFLKLMVDKHGTPDTPEEEAALLSMEIKPPLSPGSSLEPGQVKHCS